MNRNTPKSQRSDAEDDVVAMVPCQDCGHMVPEMNLMIHKLRACQARARAPDTAPDPHAHASAHTSAPEVSAPSSPPQSPVVPFLSTTPDHGIIRQRRGAQKRDLADLSATPQATEPPPPQLQPDVIDLVDSPFSCPDKSSNENHDSTSSSCDVDTNSEWACPKCTLLNDVVSDMFCAACRHENPHRPPDAMRNEQLLPNNSNSPLMMAGGGALLGGALGGIGSLMRGRSLFSGAVEGAMSGAVGGVVFSEVLNNQNQNNHPTAPSTTTSTTTHQGNQNNNDDLAHARSSAVFGIPGYPSMSSSPATNDRRRAQPRSSYRVVTRTSGGTTTTIVTGGNGTSRTIVNRNHNNNNNNNNHQHDNAETMAGVGAEDIQDPMLQLVLHSLMQQQQQGGGGGGHVRGLHDHAHGDNVDDMDYEQLLQAFGTGTEHLGATPGQISQLPEHILTNPKTELPEDAQTCYICLELFEQGETRMTLPCLHGFHKPCATKWLLTNGSCPICKHKLG
jgi:hypothetical protein